MLPLSRIAAPIDIPEDGAALDALLERYPHHCDLWHARGHCYLADGEPAKAIEAYSQAITLGYLYHPLIHFESSTCHWNRAQLHWREGNVAAARAYCDAAIFQDHRNIPALLLRRFLAHQSGDARMVEKDSRALIHLGIALPPLEAAPTLPDYTEALPTFAAWDHAIGLFKKPGIHPPLTVSEALHDEAFATQSSAMMEAAARALPQHPLPARHLSQWAMRAQQWDTARHWADQAITRLKPWHERYHEQAAMHHLHRGLVFTQQGEFSLAANDSRKAKDLHPELAH